MSEKPIIQITDSAMSVIEEHSFSRVDVEVGGFLLGKIDGNSVVVDAAKPALTAESNQTHLTITHEAWGEILGVMDTEFSGLAIVGWYHTHPGFGLFLSDYDIFIQENFFSSPGQFALVVDPLIGKLGTFVARNEKSIKISESSTKRDAIAAEGVDRIAAVEQFSGARKSSSGWKVAAVVALLIAIFGSAGAWYFGNMQGQDSALSVLAQKDSQIRQLQQAGTDPNTGQKVQVTTLTKVQKGEGWFSIARRLYGRENLWGSVAILKQANLVDGRVPKLKPGSEVLVPDQWAYVQVSDSEGVAP